MREEIESYLASFHEGAAQQRYHLENFMRWRDSNQRPAPTHKELIELARTHGRARNHPSFGHELIFSPKGLAALIEAVTVAKFEKSIDSPGMVQSSIKNA